jgi:hypothetical protein
MSCMSCIPRDFPMRWMFFWRLNSCFPYTRWWFQNFFTDYCFYIAFIYLVIKFEYPFWILLIFLCSVIGCFSLRVHFSLDEEKYPPNCICPRRRFKGEVNYFYKSKRKTLCTTWKPSALLQTVSKLFSFKISKKIHFVIISWTMAGRLKPVPVLRHY